MFPTLSNVTALQKLFGAPTGGAPNYAAPSYAAASNIIQFLSMALTIQDLVAEANEAALDKLATDGNPADAISAGGQLAAANKTLLQTNQLQRELADYQSQVSNWFLTWSWQPQAQVIANPIPPITNYPDLVALLKSLLSF